MDKVLLLTTAGCHLCQYARLELQEFASEIQIVEFDIACDERMVELYGERIPVLKTECGNELNWPFTAEEIRKLLVLRHKGS